MTTPPFPASPYGEPGPGPAARPKRPVRVWDLVLTLILVLPMLGLALLTAAFAPFLVMASDPCGAAVRCDTALMTVGVGVAFLAPLGVALIATLAVIFLLVFRRLAFWVPLVGIALELGAFALGFALVVSSVPRMTS